MENNKFSVEEVVKLALIKLGIKCDLIGFTYLTKSIVLVVEDSSLIYNLKSLFEIVAKQTEAASGFRVEANIQNALNHTYNIKGFLSMNELYGMPVFQPKYKPTTAEVIKLVAEYYNLGLHENLLTEN